jgi:hypothetical protein
MGQIPHLCDKHRRYTATCKPRTLCVQCWAAYSIIHHAPVPKEVFEQDRRERA